MIEYYSINCIEESVLTKQDLFLYLTLTDKENERDRRVNLLADVNGYLTQVRNYSLDVDWNETPIYPLINYLWND